MIDPLSPPKTDPRPNGYESRRYAGLEKLVDSRLFITVARALMIMASVIGLPIAGWMMNRIVTAADKISDKVDAGAVNLQLLDQSVKFSIIQNKADLDRVQAQVVEHEGRIRVIERTIPFVVPRSSPN